MEIKEMLRLKNKAEWEILEKLVAVISQFQKETGVGVEDICIHMTDTSTMGEEFRKYTPTNCRLHLEIE